MAKSMRVKAKAAWKRIEIPKHVFDDIKFDGLVDIQELSEYDFIKPDISGDKDKKRKASKDADTPVSKKKKKIEEQGNHKDDLERKKGRSRKKKVPPGTIHGAIGDSCDIVVDGNTFKELSDSISNSNNSGNLSRKRKLEKGTTQKTITAEQKTQSENIKKKKGKSRKKKNTNSVDDSNENIDITNSSNIVKTDQKTQSENVKKKKGRSRKKKNVNSIDNSNEGMNTTNLSSSINTGSETNLQQEAQKESVSGKVNSMKSDKNKRKKKKKKSKKSVTPVDHNSSSAAEETVADNSDLDMSKWSNLFVPSAVLKSLQEQGFQNPTTIQTLALPSAIRDHQDILAAAETGSGKTLAFGIPVVGKILSYREQREEEKQRIAEHSDEVVDDSAKDDGEEEESDMDDNDDNENDNASNNESDDDENDNASDKESDDDDENDNASNKESDDDDEDDIKSENASLSEKSPPQVLILEPTRELAVQVQRHLSRLAKHTNIQFALVVGGMSVEKQRRLLKRLPEVIIATPGRLWQLIDEGDEHLSKVDLIHSLVVDEADRMVEKGHYEELTKILHKINKSPRRNVKRQSFVMSATLTMEVAIPWRLLNKMKEKDLEKDKLKTLTSKICLGTKPKVIDLTPKAKVAQSLTEMRVNCTAKEKDYYLYYFLNQHPGRTLVFANSKDCLRRLVSVFTLLECSPFPLHADMQQRQRLKNLDRFSSHQKSLLLASDVAARGLDIPKVDYVIHYQVPQTKENYVHRSGRTARASNVGLSVMLVAPEDSRNYRKIVQGVKNGEELPMLPLDLDLLPAVKQRVNLARTIDVDQYRSKKVKLHNDFFEKAAKEMDMILDEKNLVPVKDSVANAEDKSRIKQMKYELSGMLQGSLAPLRMTKYPTKSGQLLSMKSVNLFQTA